MKFSLKPEACILTVLTQGLTFFTLLMNWHELNFIQEIFRFSLPLLAVFALILLYTIYKSSAGVVFHLRARKWSQTDGKIIRSTIQVEYGPEFTTYSPDICYQYTVANKQYQSTKIYPTLETNYSIRFFARRLIAKYPLNKEIVVHYNPHQPGQAYLRLTGLISIMLSLLITSFILSALFLSVYSRIQ